MLESNIAFQAMKLYSEVKGEGQMRFASKIVVMQQQTKTNLNDE